MPSVIHITTVDLSMRFLIFDSLKDLQSKGYEVEGICAPGDLLSQVEAEGIHVIPVPMTRRITPLKDLRALIELVRVLRREKPDLVHTHTPKANLLGQWAALMAGVPRRVSTVHGFLFNPEHAGAARVIGSYIERLSAWPSHVVFHYTDGAAQVASSLKLAAPEKIHSLQRGIGIDIRRFPFERCDGNCPTRQAARAAMGIPQNAVVAGFAGRMVGEKGLRELFEAFAIARKQVPQLRLMVVGEPDLDKPDAIAPEEAQKYGIADGCIFTGFRSNMPEMYRLMDFFVLPSYREGLGLVNVEAQCVGLPVITSDIVGARHTVEPEVTGLLVPPRNVPDLAQALVRLAENADLRRQMGEKGAERARQIFDRRLTFAQVEAEYVRLLRSRPKILHMAKEQ